MTMIGYFFHKGLLEILFAELASDGGKSLLTGQTSCMSRPDTFRVFNYTTLSAVPMDIAIRSVGWFLHISQTGLITT